MTPRDRLHRMAAGVVLAALVSGCSTSSMATPSPSGGSGQPPGPSESPSPTPGASPSSSAVLPVGWPYTTAQEIGGVLFADDGRVVLVEGDWETNRSRVVVLTEDGSPVDGWPWAPAPTGDPIARAALGPDGSLYVIVRGAAGSPIAWSWTLHRLDGAAAELPGFPVVLPPVPVCDLQVSGAGVAFVACEDGGDDAATASTIVVAIRPDGSSAPGWPVRVAGSPGVTAFWPDDTVLIGTGSEQGSTLTAVRPDGSTVPGWPRDVRSDSTFIDTDGRVRITHHDWAEGQCGPATRTTYLVLEPDGATAAGWPISLEGWSSDPLVTDDGTMYVVTDAGRAIAYAADGQEVGGWPGHEVGVAVSCGSGSQFSSAGDDGVVTVGDGSATLLSPVGQPRADWQLALPYTLASACLWCTPGPAGPIAPAIGAQGIWVAAYDGDPRGDALPGAQPRIIGIDRAGTLLEDWQQAVGTGGDELQWVRISPTGRVWAGLGLQSGGASLHLVAEDAVPGR